ncbi:TIGR03915 family putative DNA repair protein [Candidatus Dependentiae bacterium]|nr:TIGR03915 family putative DNA repair protein [Candidatus Dependentiae bacterium]
MKFYLYDGTFEGMLTAFSKAFDVSEEIIIKSSNNFIPELFAETETVETNKQLAESLFKKIYTILDTRSFKDCMYAFVSEADNAENIIFAYIKLYFNHHKSIRNFLANPVVKSLNELSLRVVKEIHRMKGMMRFVKTNDSFFYAQFEPDHNIIYFLVNHFINRMADQKFIIHDVARNLAVYYDTVFWESVIINELGIKCCCCEEEDSEKLAVDEKKYQKLWQAYFKSIAIPQRKNSRLQRQFMPRRYWKYLIETFN